MNSYRLNNDIYNDKLAEKLLADASDPQKLTDAINKCDEILKKIRT